VRGAEPSLHGDGVAPDGEGNDLFDGVAFLAAVVFAVGEGVVFGRDAARKIDEAADLLGWVKSAAGFAEQGGVRGRHFGDGNAAFGANENFLDEGRAVEAGAGGFPLFAFELVERDSGARDGEFGLRLLFFGAVEGGKIPEVALEGSLGGGLVAIEQS
jgi:hypothetical protein